MATVSRRFLLKVINFRQFVPGLRTHYTARSISTSTCRPSNEQGSSGQENKPKKSDLKKANTPTGRLDDRVVLEREEHNPAPYSEEKAYDPWPNDTNPYTGEKGGPKGPEPTRYGDWERKGRCIDF
ncbi:succinate dehydrogenase assembly factor 4, mitochondrial-like [Lingula anatina]|uniref:Succinate dehydrogenase assembly factor 4, mitochondrial n=1 Tax=Lingula anatina TaxID=7574 RepID=A0A1S3KFK3_LINAN|nr:succinate dehydrogenase assembly factor 4, mitochondrial-like [Lingula anatina]|eukprot:XP_013421267.1 succinate dehydrogenase assembly factor 4, mitochondrial-like [Lingula anatina]